jgi:hypothetical protein
MKLVTGGHGLADQNEMNVQDGMKAACDIEERTTGRMRFK